MTNTGRKKRRKNAVVTMAFRLFFVLLLLSMLAAYISNQVTISSKRAELETLNEQVAQQQTENQELQRVLSGDADQIPNGSHATLTTTPHPTSASLWM